MALEPIRIDLPPHLPPLFLTVRLFSASLNFFQRFAGTKLFQSIQPGFLRKKNFIFIVTFHFHCFVSHFMKLRNDSNKRNWQTGWGTDVMVLGTQLAWLVATEMGKPRRTPGRP